MDFIIVQPTPEKEHEKDHDNKIQKKLENIGLPLPMGFPLPMSMPPASNISSYENHINFYSIVDKWSVLSLQRELRITVYRLLDARKAAEDKGLKVEVPPVVLHINSPGGSLFDCMAMIDYITQIKKAHSDIKIHSVVEGCAASAATLISVVCDRRFITEHAHMLIHQLSAGAWGKYNDIKEAVQNMDRLMSTINTIYTKHTKISYDKLQEILKHDFYWDAEKCLENGLVDEIIKS